GEIHCLNDRREWLRHARGQCARLARGRERPVRVTLVSRDRVARVRIEKVNCSSVSSPPPTTTSEATTAEQVLAGFHLIPASAALARARKIAASIHSYQPAGRAHVGAGLAAAMVIDRNRVPGSAQSVTIESPPCGAIAGHSAMLRPDARASRTRGRRPACDRRSVRDLRESARSSVSTRSSLPSFSLLTVLTLEPTLPL